MEKKLGFLLSPWLILTASIGGIVNGIFFKDFSVKLEPLGSVFLAAIQMCLVPVLICAITTNVAKLLNHEGMSKYLKRFLSTLPVGLVVSSLLGALIAFVTGVGNRIDDRARNLLGQLLANSNHHSTTLPGAGYAGFFQDLFPTNIFLAISQDRNLSILIFSMAFGISLGFVTHSGGKLVIQVFDTLFESFLRIINATMYALPIGLFALLSVQISKIGLDVILSLSFFVLLVSLGMIAVVVVSSIMISWVTKVSPWQTVKSLKEAYLVALGTSSSFATMPISLRCLKEKLGIEEHATNLILPLGMCLNPWGSAFFFSFMSVSQLYKIPIPPTSYPILVLGSILVSVAGAGIPAVGTFAIMNIVLSPLGIPPETAVVVILATTPILDPLITLANVSGICATTVVVAGKKNYSGTLDLEKTSLGP